MGYFQSHGATLLWLPGANPKRSSYAWEADLWPLRISMSDCSGPGGAGLSHPLQSKNLLLEMHRNLLQSLSAAIKELRPFLCPLKELHS